MVVIPGLLLLYWLPVFIFPGTLTPVFHLQEGLFSDWIYQFNDNWPVLASFLAMITVMFISFLLSRLNTIHIFIPCRTSMPALLFVLLYALYPHFYLLTPALVATILFILLLHRLLSSYHSDGLSYNFLDIGLVLSVASMFYMPVLLFYPVLTAGMIRIRPPRWREYVFTVIGMLLPYLFLFSIVYLIGKNPSVLIRQIPVILLTTKETELTRAGVLSMSVIISLVVLSIVYVFRTLRRMKTQARNFLLVFLWLLAFAILIIMFIPQAGGEMICFGAIPAAYLLSLYFSLCKKTWVNEVLFGLLFAGVAAFRLLN